MKAVLAALASICMAGQAYAVPMVVLDGSSKVDGVTGLVVGGMVFDVTFIDEELTYD